MFLTDAPAMLERLRQATKAGDTKEMAAAAHAIKGSVGLFTQGDAFVAARNIEQIARGGDVMAAAA